jgi:hypothetical protein
MRGLRRCCVPILPEDDWYSEHVQVGDIPHKLVGGNRAREVPMHEVEARMGVLVRNRSTFGLIGRAAAYAQIPHAFAHTVARGALKLIGHEARDEASAETLVGLQPSSGQPLESHA